MITETRPEERGKRLPGWILGLLFIFLFSFEHGLAVQPDEEPLRGKIMEGILLTIDNRFDEAERLYEELIRQYPDHPMGYFYKGATIQAQMLDAEDYSRRKEFFHLMALTINKARALRKVRPSDAWLFFYEGSAFLYRSFMKSKQGSWFGAYRDAVRGVGRLELALKQDSTLYDAYLGLGSYKYWKSARANFLLWLHFISDEREEGIELVRKSIRKGQFVYWIGRDQLCWILLDKGDCRQALQLARENHRAYPRSRFFRWTLVEAAFKCGEYDLSAELYHQLLEEVKQLPKNNHYNELECLVRLAEIGVKNQNWEVAYRYADEALRIPLSSDIRKRAEKKMQRALKAKKISSRYLSRLK